MQEMTEQNPNISLMSPQSQKASVKGWKMATIALSATVILGGSILGYLVMDQNGRLNKSENETKEAKIEINKAREVIEKYETATKTKVEEIKNEKQETIKQIVMPTTYDVKLDQLLEKIGRGAFMTRGELFTNDAGTYAFAKLGLVGTQQIKDKLGNEVSALGIGGWGADYYRELPNGEWKLAAQGHTAPKCTEINDEVRKAYRTLKEKYKCRDESDNFIDY